MIILQKLVPYKGIQRVTSDPLTTEIIEENNYYPYGLKLRGFNTSVSSLGNSVAKKYMFNGKEFDDGFNETLNTYDFGARNYDPALGRWMNLDPLAEQMRRHSPYNYAFDNPIYFIDPDGMMPQGAGGPGDELIKKAKEGANNIVGKFFDLIYAFAGDSNSELPSNDKSQNKDFKKDRSKIDAVVDFNEAVDENSGDVGIGLAFVAGDALDKGGSEVAEKASTLTLASGGTTSEVTVPAAVVGSTVSIVGKSIKGTVLYFTGNESAAADEAISAGTDVALNIAQVGVMKKLKNSGALNNKTESNIVSTIITKFKSAFFSDDE